jgi:ribose transport system substrate-binding protein
MEEIMNNALAKWATLLVILVSVIGLGLLFASLITTNEATPSRIEMAPSENRVNLSVNREKILVYIVSDLRIPFWAIMARGIKNRANALGYKLEIYSAQNSRKSELEFTAKAIRSGAAGIIISPTTSSACATVLKLASAEHIPVVISDIGTDGGKYLSYISSDNKTGAYEIGKVLAEELHRRGWQNGRVGIISIPQKRLNGQLRTAGFMKAMAEGGIKGADIKQQETFSYDETYKYSKELIEKYPDLRALWLQGSDRYQGALDAIEDAGRKDQILLATFDAEPEFLELIPKEVLVGSAMQQPYLMGEEAVHVMDDFLKGKTVKKNIQMPILAISTQNISLKLSTIKRNVLGIEVEK